MYMAMNRFKIISGKEKEFEKIWIERETYLEQVKGFQKFNLVKGKDQEGYTLYASHSTWNSEEDFLNWTKSESFRKAHKDSGRHKGLYLGHPEFEGFKIVI